MSTFPVVRGTRLRATKIDRCGLPKAGARNRVVTKGFVTAKITKVMRDAQDLEQTNADGEVCVSDRTVATRKWYTPAIELCNVDTELITLFNGWQQVLDYDDLPIGFRDQTETEEDLGVMLEIWTGGRADDDCPTPTDDSIFSVASTGLKYGYFLFGGIEWQLGDIDVGASVSTFTLTGRTIPTPRWGRGPYNVAATDSSGTPGRLLVPVGQDEQLTVFRTPVTPPDVTNGAVALAVETIFVDPDFYFGGPANAPSADVAPDQVDTSASVALTITGGPTAGDFLLDIIYSDSTTQPSGTIAFNATAANVKTALVSPDDGFDASDWIVTGGTLPGGTVTIIPPAGVTLEVGANSLTGGTTPTVHLA